MKLTQVRLLLTTFALTGMLVWATGCGGGTQEGDKTKDSIDTPQVVRVEPQNFPVNNLPDSIFGKAVTQGVEKGLKIGASNLVKTEGAFPDWLDQIISRESIVLFSSGILTTLPDEVEFVQTASSQYDGPEGWKAFAVNYSTKPSGASMVVYGAYHDEQ
ncbi:MAG TPA: hypothetical protein VHS96_05015, partial [Bacteroidia bacterium]|nr:hypothetical protein [Bacteroidia bacterium]